MEPYQKGKRQSASREGWAVGVARVCVYIRARPAEGWQEKREKFARLNNINARHANYRRVTELR